MVMLMGFIYNTRQHMANQLPKLCTIKYSKINPFNTYSNVNQ